MARKKIAPAQIRRRLIYVPTLDDIYWHELYANGVRIVAFDIENTLEPLRRGQGARLLSADTLDLLKAIHTMGFKIVFATNSTSNFQPMVDQLLRNGFAKTDIFLFQPRKAKPQKRWQIWKYLRRKSPRKPQLGYFSELYLTQNAQPHQIIMVGDKLNFDVIPAIKAGYFRAYWIHPCGPDLPLEFGRRWRERFTARRYGLPQIQPDPGD